MSISVKEANTIIDEKNKEYRDLAIRFRNVCNDLDKKDKEIERLRKSADFLTDEYNKKKAARNYVIAHTELFDDFICTSDDFEVADLLETFDIGDKKC